MKSSPPPPTGTKVDTPPEPKIFKRPKFPKEIKKESFESKNPTLSNFFHYGIIGILLIIVFVISALFIASRLAWTSLNPLTAVIIILLGGSAGVYKVCRWASSKDFDKDDRGF